jgi:hypothetical protein
LGIWVYAIPPVKPPPTATPDGFVIVVVITNLVRLHGGPKLPIPYILPPKDGLGALTGTVVPPETHESPPKAPADKPPAVAVFIVGAPQALTSPKSEATISYLLPALV